MIYDDIQLHNVAEVREIAGYDGVRLQRVPEDVRLQLNEDARHRMLAPTNAEIRFVPDGRTETTLSAPCGGVHVTPFWGPFKASREFDIGHDPETIALTVPEKIPHLDPSDYEEYFSPRVCRLVLSGNTGMRGDWPLYHGTSSDAGSVRPPTSEELPNVQYLAYGTSITEGGAATGIHLSYAAQTARRLRADLLNLGTSGSAHAENELADHIADRDDWDVATLALSVNMLGFDEAEFRNRVSYMVETVGRENPNRQVVCLSSFPNHHHARPTHDTERPTPKSRRFREILREIVEATPHRNVGFAAGPDLLADIAGLSTDYGHPADDGHIRIAERLAPQLEALL